LFGADLYLLRILVLGSAFDVPIHYEMGEKMNQSFTELSKLCRWMSPPKQDETDLFTLKLWQYETDRPDRNDLFNKEYLSELRNHIDTILVALEGTEYYKFIFLKYMNEIYRVGDKAFHAYPDRYSESGICVAFWYGESEVSYSEKFVTELVKCDSETETAPYLLFDKDRVAFFKRRNTSLTHEIAFNDGIFVMSSLIKAGY